MGWPSLLSDLPFWANVGSVAGAVFTFGAFFYQLKLGRRYRLLLRGPELLEDLAELGSQLNDYEELSSQEQKTVLSKTRTVLRSSSAYLQWRQRFWLYSPRLSLWWYWKDAPDENVETYYAVVQRVHTALNYRIRDRQVEQ